MAKEQKPAPARETSATPDERIARIYEILERGTQIREEDIKRAAEQREADRKQREADRKRDEEQRAKDRKRDEERSAKAAEEMAEIRQGIKETRRIIGVHTNNEGELLEAECRVALLKMGELDGVKIEAVLHGRTFHTEHGSAEVDLVGINGKVVFPVEVKRSMSPEDVRHFAKVRVKRFRKAFPDAKGKEVRPVVVFGLPRSGESKEDPVEVALGLGLIVMQSIGENKLAPITDPSQVIKRRHKD